MCYGSLSTAELTIEVAARDQKPWLALHRVIHSHLQGVIDCAHEHGYDLEDRYVCSPTHVRKIEGGPEDGWAVDDEPTVTLLFRRRETSITKVRGVDAEKAQMTCGNCNGRSYLPPMELEPLIIECPDCGHEGELDDD